MDEKSPQPQRDTTPKHGDPAENLSPNESVINVRVGSEAAVESGTGPVLPPAGGNLNELTRVRNKDLRTRDEKEFEKRGPAGGTHAVSVNFEGLMMVEVDGRAELRSGSYSGSFVNSITIRPLSAAEAKKDQASREPTQPPGVGTSTSRGSGR